MTYRERMRDAAYASDIPLTWAGVVAGYVNGGDPYHPWPSSGWGRFPRNRKLPIFVRSNPTDRSEAEADAVTNLRDLYLLKVPRGCITALDLETAKDPPYVSTYGAVMRYFGYRVWTYGSESTLFSNPPLDGRWVAVRTAEPSMVPGVTVRATQYANPPGSGGQWDSSAVKWWQIHHGKWWV